MTSAGGSAPLLSSQAKLLQARSLPRSPLPDWIARERRTLAGSSPSRWCLSGRRASGRWRAAFSFIASCSNSPSWRDAERATHIAAVVKRAGFAPALCGRADDAHRRTPCSLNSCRARAARRFRSSPKGRPGARNAAASTGWCATASGLLIADYKTDRSVPATPEACNPEYLSQMATYRDALRLIHPGEAAARLPGVDGGTAADGDSR